MEWEVALSFAVLGGVACWAFCAMLAAALRLCERDGE